MLKNLRLILFPFSMIYAGITGMRNLLYDYKILQSKSFDIPVINVGNLRMGGTGKTPQIEYLIRLLSQKYKRIAVVSRGYKRQTKGFILADEKSTPEQIGDEPYQIHKKFKNLSVAVSEKRAFAIRKLLTLANPPQIILLDDAFQHRQVKASLNILLTEFARPFYKDFILPVGNLRESRRGAKRADMVIVTKCPDKFSEKEREKIIKNIRKYTTAPVFFSYIKYCDKVIGKNKELTLEKLKDYKILLITGIANPDKLYDFLSKKNIKFEGLKYGDHHFFKPSDIRVIKDKFKQINAKQKIVLTTEKDYVRLKKHLDLPIFYIPIETEFIEKEMFNTKILNYDYSIK